LKFVRSRLPASVSVATQPVSALSLITNGDSSMAVSFVSEELELAAGGGTVCADVSDESRNDVARIRMHETRSDALMGGMGDETRQRLPVGLGCR
jgi:hypothetical protein